MTYAQEYLDAMDAIPTYYDCNGNTILPGMVLTDGNGYEESVLVCGNVEVGFDLGFNVVNFGLPSVQQGLSKWVCYPLSVIDLSELYIKQ